MLYVVKDIGCMSVPISPRRRKLYRKGRQPIPQHPVRLKNAHFVAKGGILRKNCWKKYPDKTLDRRVKDEAHYQERTSSSPKREVKEEASSSQGLSLFGTHFMDYNSTFTRHIEQVNRDDSDVDAMELRSSTMHQRQVTSTKDHVDEEGRQNRSRQVSTVVFLATSYSCT